MTLWLTLWLLKPQQTLTCTRGIPWPALRVRVLMGWGQGQPGNTPGLPMPITNDTWMTMNWEYEMHLHLTSQVLFFYYGMTKEEQAQDAFVSWALGMFFLLLLINDLCLDYLYRNHNDHNDEWPPSSQHKQGARTRYVLFFKNLLLFSLLDVYLQQTYHNGNEWPLLSLSAEWTQARDADVSWFQYVNFLYFFFFHTT